MNIYEEIELIGIVPVIKIDDANDAVPVCKALADGGLPVAEITFRTDAAEESIRQVAKSLPEVIVGAGTVLTIDQAAKAVEAGARFIVTPGFNPDVVKWCVDRDIAIVPGCPTTSDIEAALKFGLKYLKFFPSEALGGLNTIKAISAPYSSVRFMPTGGVNEKNMAEYLSFDKIIAVGGSWMVNSDLIREKSFDTITGMSKAAVQNMLGFELAHIGINAECEESAKLIAGQFELLFKWPIKNGNSSIFAGPGIEVTKSAGRGTNGHIAVRTNSILRARAHLEKHGFEFDEASAAVKNGKLIAIYLKNEIGGFAVHLLQK